MVPEEWQQHQEIFLEMQIPGPTDQTLGGGVKGEGCEQVIQVIPTHAQFENQSLGGTCSSLHCDCELVKGRNVFIFVSSVFHILMRQACRESSLQTEGEEAKISNMT